MKRIFAFIFIVSLIPGLCACGKEEEKPTEPETSKVIEISSTEEPEAEFGIYQEIIDEYLRVLKEGDPKIDRLDGYIDDGIVSFSTYFCRPEKMYYALIDLSDDGQPELLIGGDSTFDDDSPIQIFDAWGCENGTPKRIFDDGIAYKRLMIIHKDKSIYFDSGTNIGFMFVCNLKPDGIEIEGEGVGFDFEDNLRKYKINGLYDDIDKLLQTDNTPISKEEFDEMTQDMVSHERMQIDWIPLQ